MILARNLLTDNGLAACLRHVLTKLALARGRPVSEAEVEACNADLTAHLSYKHLLDEILAGKTCNSAKVGNDGKVSAKGFEDLRLVIVTVKSCGTALDIAVRAEGENAKGKAAALCLTACGLNEITVGNMYSVKEAERVT